MKIMVSVMVLMIAFVSYGQTVKPSNKAIGSPGITPATKPTTQPVAPTKQLILKAGAPAVIQDWFRNLPTIAKNWKSEERKKISDLCDNEKIAAGLPLQQLNAYLAKRQTELRTEEETYEKIRNRKIGTVTQDKFTKMTDMKAMAQKDRDQRRQRDLIASIKKDIADTNLKIKLATPQLEKYQNTIDADYQIKLNDFDNDPTPVEVSYWESDIFGQSIPILSSMKVGSWGLTGNIRIVQVVTKSEMIVQMFDPLEKKSVKIWLSGIDTTNLVDDQDIDYPQAFIISKTKAYTTVSNSKVTLFYAEPFPLFDYVKVETR